MTIAQAMPGARSASLQARHRRMPLLRSKIAAWHVAGAIVLAGLGVLVCFADWQDLWNIFRHDEESSHIIMAPLVAAILAWVRRERLRNTRIHTSWVGPIVVAAGCLIACYGDGHGYQLLRHVGAVTVVVGCLLTMLGLELLINFAPAFLGLAFLIPMPPTLRQKISLPLEGLNAYVTADILNVLGVPALRSGNQLYINGHTLSVVEACNGLRSFFTLVMVAYLVAFFVSLRGYVRVIFVALSPVAALLCNVVRLILTASIYGYAGQAYGEAFHSLAGWIILPLAFGLLYAVVWALRWAMVPVSPFTLARD